MEIQIRPIKQEDQSWVTEKLKENWGSSLIISRGKVHNASKLPGFVVFQGNRGIGMATYKIDDLECELVTLDSWMKNQMVGTHLINAVKREAIKARCVRLWLMTTNDNMHALTFFQKRGFHLIAVHPNALVESRRIKPSIPEIGLNGIPLRDELELQIMLNG